LRRHLQAASLRRRESRQVVDFESPPSSLRRSPLVAPSGSHLPPAGRSASSIRG
jgi:hypothetical protein